VITRLKLKPDQKGTKLLVEKYGDSLLCVRYRYDEKLFTPAGDDGANTYKLIYSMYPFHQFNASDGKEYDWLNVEQEGILSAKIIVNIPVRLISGLHFTSRRLSWPTTRT
jgi:hypothetical protein